MCMVRAQVPGSSAVAYLGASAVSRIDYGGAKTSTGTLAGDSGFTSSSLTYHTTLAPLCVFMEDLFP